MLDVMVDVLIIRACVAAHGMQYTELFGNKTPPAYAFRPGNVASWYDTIDVVALYTAIEVALCGI